MHLTDRVVVVTGSRGIAAAGARRIVQGGGTAFVVGRDPEELHALKADLRTAAQDARERIDAAVADLTDEQATVDAFAACRSRFGRIDGLFAVAGGSGRRFGDGPLHELTVDGWEATLQLNGVPTVLAAREAVRAMRAQSPSEAGSRGAVVIVTSVLAHAPSPALFGTAAYAAVKGAQAALVRQLAATYAVDGIRVNAVAPGLVATPMSARAQSDPVIGGYATRKQPLAAGFLPPEAIADAAAFLLGDGSRFVTGQVLDVDGGWSVTEALP